MEETPLKDMSMRQLRSHVTAHLLELSEWDPDNEASAVRAVDTLRRHMVRCMAALQVILGRLIDGGPEAQRRSQGRGRAGGAGT